MNSKKRILLKTAGETLLFLVIMYPEFQNKIYIGIQTLLYCIVGWDIIYGMKRFSELREAADEGNEKIRIAAKAIFLIVMAAIGGVFPKIFTHRIVIFVYLFLFALMALSIKKDISMIVSD